MNTVITPFFSGWHCDRQLTLGCPSKCGNRYHSVLPTPSFKIEKINEPMIMIFKVVSDQITVLRGSRCVKCEMEAASPSTLQHRASPGLQLGAQLPAGAHAACFRVETVLSSGAGPPTTQSIGRRRVGPERAGTAASLPAAPSGPLSLGWSPRGEDWDTSTRDLSLEGQEGSGEGERLGRMLQFLLEWTTLGPRLGKRHTWASLHPQIDDSFSGCTSLLLVKFCPEYYITQITFLFMGPIILLILMFMCTNNFSVSTPSWQLHCLTIKT